ncbi:MAG: hypothetical protein ACI306_04035, partial [Muribaculaceae bacterium]
EAGRRPSTGRYAIHRVRTNNATTTRARRALIVLRVLCVLRAKPRIAPSPLSPHPPPSAPLS